MPDFGSAFAGASAHAQVRSRKPHGTPGVVSHDQTMVQSRERRAGAILGDLMTSHHTPGTRSRHALLAAVLAVMALLAMSGSAFAKSGTKIFVSVDPSAAVGQKLEVGIDVVGSAREAQDVSVKLGDGLELVNIEK